MMKKNKKVFLVEDDPVIADIYKTLLEKFNFNVEVFGLGQEFIKSLAKINKEDKPDIVLLDLILPDINGMDVFSAIKNNNTTKDVKVFILTNQDEKDIPQSDIKPDRFIIKANIAPTKLAEIVKEALR